MFVAYFFDICFIVSDFERMFAGSVAWLGKFVHPKLISNTHKYFRLQFCEIFLKIEKVILWLFQSFLQKKS
jgi:hypothetical protein